MNAPARDLTKPGQLLREIAREYVYREHRATRANERGDSEGWEHWRSRVQDMENNIQVSELNGSWR